MTSGNVSVDIDWETDEWPKECDCGYEAEDTFDAVDHGVREHRNEVLNDG